MITPEDFVLQWTYSDLNGDFPAVLVQFDPAAVQSLKIPEYAKHFLIEAGLPLEDGKDVPSVGLPSLEEQYGDTHDFPPEIHRLRVLSVAVHDSTRIWAFICLDELHGGNVMFVYEKWGEKFVAEFLNSSVVQYAEALLILRRYHMALVRVNWADQGQGEFDDGPNVFNDAVKTFGQETLHKLRLLDPPSFQVGTAWEEQMYYLEGGIT